MKKIEQLHKNVSDGFIAVLEREIRWAEEEFARLKSEDFKDAALREEMMSLMTGVSRCKDLLKIYQEVKELKPEGEKPKEGDEKPAIGFMNFKEAA